MKIPGCAIALAAALLALASCGLKPSREEKLRQIAESDPDFVITLPQSRATPTMRESVGRELLQQTMRARDEFHRVELERAWVGVDVARLRKASPLVRSGAEPSAEQQELDEVLGELTRLDRELERMRAHIKLLQLKLDVLDD